MVCLRFVEMEGMRGCIYTSKNQGNRIKSRFFSISLHFRKEDLSICMYLWSKNDSNHLEDGPRILVTSSKWGEIT